MTRCQEAATHLRAEAAAMRALAQEPRLRRAALAGRVARSFYRALCRHQAQCGVCNASYKADRPLRRIERETRNDEEPDSEVVNEMVAAYLHQVCGEAGAAVHGLEGSEPPGTAPGAAPLCEVA